MKDLIEEVKKLKEIVSNQEKDDCLFFVPVYVTESFLQDALIELHKIIKGIDYE